MLRKNFLIKNVPIIMVTGNTGIIDRGKARLAGATDYLTKPFTQAELKDMVIKHLK
ncbi:MAG TPA: response regulator [Allocoleopsis sp.]